MPLSSLSMTLAIQVAKTLADSRQQDLLPSQTGKTHRTTRTSRSLEFRLHAGLASWPLMSAWKEKPKPPWDADQTRRFYLVGRTADTRHSRAPVWACVSCSPARSGIVVLVFTPGAGCREHRSWIIRAVQRQTQGPKKKQLPRILFVPPL
ncbi:hypothetical protein GQ607_015394 [Colletotrichum asianum]|uniref:Uncharacterized protein n=1 Tax=Colletotrichum asianum TaxID=702518 RepID=A0A8H3ZIQ3_9PEZI|nr:hypothetical protein GQ607_015394 [Colletotrichum asianum]